MATKKKPVAGEGTRFKQMTKSLAKKGVKDPGAVAASIGRKKYGDSDMAKASAAGRKGKVHVMKKGGK